MRLEKISNTMTPPRRTRKWKRTFFLKTLEKGKTLLTHVLINKVVKDTKTKNFVAKPHEKSLARSHLQPMSKLPPSVNRLAKVNVTKMMIEEKDHKSFFEFWREEAEKTQEYGKYMTELCLRMTNHSHCTNPNLFVHNQLSSSFISPSQFTPPMSSSTPPFSPVSWIGTLSNKF